MQTPASNGLLALVNRGQVDDVIVANLARLSHSVNILCSLLELFEKRKVALISVAESLDSGGTSAVAAPCKRCPGRKCGNRSAPFSDRRRLAQPALLFWEEAVRVPGESCVLAT